MADLSITAANVAVGSASTPTKIKQAGEAITQGMAVYKATDTKYYKCDADALVSSVCDGIALTPANTDGYFLLAEPSSTPGVSLVNLGASLTAGLAYYISTTPGGICVVADLSTGDFATLVGFATSSTLIDLRAVASQTAKA